jgi:hypothetical protein
MRALGQEIANSDRHAIIRLASPRTSRGVPTIGRGRRTCGSEVHPSGFAPYRQLTTLGVACRVVVPELTPRKQGDWIKTVLWGRLSESVYNHSSSQVLLPPPTA